VQDKDTEENKIDKSLDRTRQVKTTWQPMGQRCLRNMKYEKINILEDKLKGSEKQLLIT
jgi:hypothetical protein